MAGRVPARTGHRSCAPGGDGRRGPAGREVFEMGRRIREVLGRPARAVVLAGPLLAGLAAACATAEGEEAAPQPKWYEEVSVNGMASVSWSYNFNRPDSGTNQYRVFDFGDDSIKVDVVDLVIQKAVSKPGEAGFRVDAAAGASIPRMTAASGLFRDPATGEAEDFDLQQAFVSWIAPVGNGLRLDAGKFFTIAGYEYVDRWDGTNDNATRSFQFGYAEPVTHTGLKASYAFSDAVSALVMVTNGWDVVKDNNSSKSLGAGLTLAPGPGVTFSLSYLYGPERQGDNTDNRGLFNVIATLKPTDTVTVGFNLDWGTEQGLAADGGTAGWWGTTGYLRLGVTPTFALAFRAEYFDDQDGVRTGTVQKLKELTLTPELKVSPHLVFRGDLRIDFSDGQVFEDSDGAFTKKQQPTFLLNALYTF